MAPKLCQMKCIILYKDLAEVLLLTQNMPTASAVAVSAKMLGAPTLRASSMVDNAAFRARTLPSQAVYLSGTLE